MNPLKYEAIKSLCDDQTIRWEPPWPPPQAETISEPDEDQETPWVVFRARLNADGSVSATLIGGEYEGFRTYGPDDPMAERLRAVLGIWK